MRPGVDGLRDGGDAGGAHDLRHQLHVAQALLAVDRHKLVVEDAVGEVVALRGELDCRGLFKTSKQCPRYGLSINLQSGTYTMSILESDNRDVELKASLGVGHTHVEDIKDNSSRDEAQVWHLHQ